MLPVFASKLLDANARAATEGREPVALNSVVMVNGFTNYMTYDFAQFFARVSLLTRLWLQHFSHVLRHALYECQPSTATSD